jgi:hypothetical protein
MVIVDDYSIVEIEEECESIILSDSDSCNDDDDESNPTSSNNGKNNKYTDEQTALLSNEGNISSSTA